MRFGSNCRYMCLCFIIVPKLKIKENEGSSKMVYYIFVMFFVISDLSFKKIIFKWINVLVRLLDLKIELIIKKLVKN
jgi:hypothetical protein